MRSEYRLILLLLAFLLSTSFDLNGQEDTNKNPSVIELDKIISDNKRDEVQRYFGYEDLLFRYLTLPYDLSSNTNQQGRYVDFGYTLFMVLPIVFLGLVYKHRKLFYATMALFILYLSLCLSFSFHNTPNYGQVYNHGNQWESYSTNTDKNIVEHITTGIFNVSHSLSRPFRSLGARFSGNNDHVTYPLLILLFLGSLWIVVGKLGSSPKGEFLATIFIAFSFLWLILSSGIIWYGFLMIPLGLFVIGHYLSNKKFKGYTVQPIITTILFSFLIIWVSMCWVGRISNIKAQSNGGNTTDIGKGILEPETLKYSTGFRSIEEARSSTYPNINGALDKINSDNALILQVGTFFAFDIKNNSTRLLQDNTLVQFHWLVTSLKEKDKIIAALKASNFKYILIDYYTPTLDKTPEKSLTQKYKLLLNTVYNNPALKLLATDRIVKVKQADGSVYTDSKVFGEIQNFGTYAIYEIL